MLLTERILIKPNHSHFKEVDRLCRLTAHVTNQALYYFRQAFFNHERVKWSSVDKIVKLHHSERYNAIPNAISQQVIKKVGTDFTSFWQAYKSWKKSPVKFKEKPKIPHYQKVKTAIQSAQGVSIKDGNLQFPKKLNLAPLKIHCAEQQAVLERNSSAIVKELRYVPHGSCYWLEIVFDENKILSKEELNKRNVKLNPNNVFGIDLGINNLVTLVSNKPNFKPVLFNGKPVKSLNQRYNKSKAELQGKGHRQLINHLSVKRFCQINDIFHKISHSIIELCLKNDIGKIVIGKNKDWKQKVNIGKANNQQFVSVPHQALIKKITYKAIQYNIEVVEQEESYTSKADSLALDELPTYQKANTVPPIFSGKRKQRGLYQSSTGKLINADVNGGLNILRKVIGDDFIGSLINKGAVFAPMRLTVH